MEWWELLEYCELSWLHGQKAPLQHAERKTCRKVRLHNINEVAFNVCGGAVASVPMCKPFLPWEVLASYFEAGTQVTDLELCESAGLNHLKGDAGLLLGFKEFTQAPLVPDLFILLRAN